MKWKNSWFRTRYAQKEENVGEFKEKKTEIITFGEEKEKTIKKVKKVYITNETPSHTKMNLRHIAQQHAFEISTHTKMHLRHLHTPAHI